VAYYEASDPPWHDSQGRPVKNWKQKYLAVWAKSKPPASSPAESLTREVSEEEAAAILAKVGAR
jgi:hypothetical protein